MATSVGRKLDQVEGDVVVWSRADRDVWMTSEEVEDERGAGRSAFWTRKVFVARVPN